MQASFFRKNKMLIDFKKPQPEASKHLPIVKDSQNQNQVDANDSRVKFKLKKQNKANFSLSLNTRSSLQEDHTNLSKADEEGYNKITNNIRLNLKQKLKKPNPQLTKTAFFCFNEDSFVTTDPNRISRYRQPMGEAQKDRQKWDKSIERYMQARTKMSIFFNETKKTSGEFNSIQLDRNNLILKNRKMLQLKKMSPKNNGNERSASGNEFVSYLIPKANSEGKSMQNQMIKSVSMNGSIRRCDALLVNFVSTYFRRKFYKKNKKFDSVRRMKTDDPELMEMVALQGNSIDDEIINTSMFESIDAKIVEKDPKIFK